MNRTGNRSDLTTDTSVWAQRQAGKQQASGLTDHWHSGLMSQAARQAESLPVETMIGFLLPIWLKFKSP